MHKDYNHNWEYQGDDKTDKYEEYYPKEKVHGYPGPMNIVVYGAKYKCSLCGEIITVSAEEVRFAMSNNMLIADLLSKREKRFWEFWK